MPNALFDDDNKRTKKGTASALVPLPRGIFSGRMGEVFHVKTAHPIVRKHLLPFFLEPDPLPCISSEAPNRYDIRVVWMAADIEVDSKHCHERLFLHYRPR